MDVKQSFQNMIGWAKKNPVLAGGIVLVLVLVAWWVSKQGGGSNSEMAADEGDSYAPAPVLSGGDDGSLLDTIKEPVEGITQPAPVYDAPVFDALPSIPVMQESGMFDPGSVQDFVAAAPSMSSGVGKAMENVGAKKATGVLSMAGATSSGFGTKESVAKKATKAVTKTGSVGGSVKTNIPVRASVTVPKTTKPVAKFTGWKDGIFYLNGIPMTFGVAPTISPTGTTGSRTPTTTKRRSK